ncbi:HlyD family efflux transporter periplasmic adaptor subunit [Shimia sp. W99]
MTTDNPADPANHRTGDTGQVSYAIFDQALWNQFSGARSITEYLGAWLALMCRSISGAKAAVVVLGDPDTGPFSSAAHWPEEKDVGQALMAATEQALGKRQPVMAKTDTTNEISLPILVDDQLYGAASVTLENSGLAPVEALRHLRWASGWIEVVLRRDQGQTFEKLQSRTASALAMLATVLEQKRFSGAANALVTELAQSLDCDPVSLGFVRRKNVKMSAISHAAGFGKRMSLIRDIRAAMNEAIDQEAVVLFPVPEGWDFRVTLAHEELSRAHKADSVLTVPIQYDGEIIGALTLERTSDRAFDEDTVALVDAIATVVGPVLEEKRRNDRFVITKIFESLGNQLVALLGPRNFGRKFATILFIAVVWFFANKTTTFKVTAPAELQGAIQRTVVAPFNGYLADETVQAGSLVEEGQVLARLDDRDLVLERLRMTTTRAQRQAEYDLALANRERAEANIIESQIRQVESQISLVDEQIARTEIRAPFSGVVVTGDLSQSIGATVERGEELFKIAPLDGWRVVLEVDEADLAEVQTGQIGQLRVASLPDLPLNYTIDRITPVSDQREGRNFFRVYADLDTSDVRLRPGMEGIARTDIDERLLISVWVRPLVNWAKLTLWRWRP